MKLSIVTISYNQAQFLERAILSVLNQKDSNIEYIVVDAGSVDGSRSIIDRYRGDIDTVIYEADRGPADGLNKGFAAATGAWFGYINSDDYYLPNSLGPALGRLKRLSSVGASVGNGYIVDEDDRQIRRSISRKFSVVEALYGATFALQQATFYSREAFERVGGFNLSNTTFWDGEILVRMSRLGYGIVRDFHDIGAFRIHGDSISGSGRLFERFKQQQDDLFYEIMGRRKSYVDRRFFEPMLKIGNTLRDPRRLAEMLMSKLSAKPLP